MKPAEIDGKDRMNLIRFFEHVLQLKSVKRAGWVAKIKVVNPETVADHTFSMCTMAMALSDILGLDTTTIMKMAILHDLAEALTGDYMPTNVSRRVKRAAEKKAMKSILGKLPATVGSNYEKIWHELLANKTSSARLVHTMDKYEMAMQARKYANEGYSKETLAQFIDSAWRAISDGSRKTIGVNNNDGNNDDNLEFGMRDELLAEILKRFKANSL